MLNLLFEIELFICIKMDLALYNLQRSICPKTHTNKQLYKKCEYECPQNVDPLTG